MPRYAMTPPSTGTGTARSMIVARPEKASSRQTRPDTTLAERPDAPAAAFSTVAAYSIKAGGPPTSPEDRQENPAAKSSESKRVRPTMRSFRGANAARLGTAPAEPLPSPGSPAPRRGCVSSRAPWPAASAPAAPPAAAGGAAEEAAAASRGAAEELPASAAASAAAAGSSAAGLLSAEPDSGEPWRRWASHTSSPTARRSTVTTVTRGTTTMAWGSSRRRAEVDTRPKSPLAHAQAPRRDSNTSLPGTSRVSARSGVARIHPAPTAQGCCPGSAGVDGTRATGLPTAASTTCTVAAVPTRRAGMMIEKRRGTYTDVTASATASDSPTSMTIVDWDPGCSSAAPVMSAGRSPTLEPSPRAARRNDPTPISAKLSSKRMKPQPAKKPAVTGPGTA
mmetsp:Transcript_20674/g.79328  ORF Transcript_20674/g.79328 Transcript_20674/m.79328 type:complete len:394 (+) Transcript_20674:1397-2578(+)